MAKNTAGQSIRERILSRTARRYLKRDVPGFGTVWFQSWTELERAQFEQITSDETVVKRWLVILSVVDDDGGNAVFGPDALEELGQVDSTVIDRLAAIAFAHNSVTLEDQTELLGKRGKS